MRPAMFSEDEEPQREKTAEGGPYALVSTFLGEDVWFGFRTNDDNFGAWAERHILEIKFLSTVLLFSGAEAGVRRAEAEAQLIRDNVARDFTPIRIERAPTWLIEKQSSTTTTT